MDEDADEDEDFLRFEVREVTPHRIFCLNPCRSIGQSMTMALAESCGPSLRLSYFPFHK